MLEKVIVVVPAYNEERTIKRVINELKDSVKKGVLFDIIVVANGCTDRTVDEVKKTGVHLIVDPTPNKGNAIIIGAKWAQKNGATIMTMVDADVVKIDSWKLKKLIEPVKQKITKMSVAKYGFRTLSTKLKPSIKYSGFRAISMSALKPLLAGNKNWVKNITTGPYGVETALNFHIFGKKYLLQSQPLPKSSVVPVNFVLTRKPRSVGEVGRNVLGITTNFMQRAEKAIRLRETRKIGLRQRHVK